VAAPRGVGLTAAALLAVGAAGAAVYERRALRRRRREQRRFRVAAERSLPDELARVVAARLDAAISALEHLDDDPSEAVHKARTSIKRVRTVLRLAGGARHREANETLRRVGRTLAPLRDAMVLPAVLDGLVRRYPAEIDLDEIIEIAERLAQRRAAASGEIEGADCPFADATGSLRAVRAQFEDSQRGADATSRGALLHDFRRLCTRGRRAHRRAAASRDSDALHAWRRRVKDLRYAAELLREADPSRLRRVEHAARELSDLLGDDHDLAVLAEQVGDHPHTHALIGRRRGELQASAFELAAQLYATSPRRLAKRVRRRARTRTAWR